MIKAPEVGRLRRVWPRTQRLLLLALLVFLVATTIFDAVIVLAVPSRAEAVILVVMMAFYQGYVIWFSFMRAAPVLRKNASEFPASVDACVRLFLVAALVSCAMTAIATYALLSAR